MSSPDFLKDKGLMALELQSWKVRASALGSSVTRSEPDRQNGDNRKRAPKMNEVPVRNYESWISSLLASQRPFQGCEHLKTLSKYLCNTSSDTEQETGRSKQHAFVHSYQSQRNGLNVRLASRTIGEFRESRRSLSFEPEVLVLSGQPSANWINCLGDELKLPAEFWTKHLDFMRANDQERYVMQSAHTTMPEILSFDIPSLAFAGTRGRFLKQEMLHAARHNVSRHISDRLKRIRWGMRNKVGDPIFRAVNVHQGDLLSMEQRVTALCLPRSPTDLVSTGPEWTVLIYSDASVGEHGLEEVLSQSEYFIGNSSISFCPVTSGSYRPSPDQNSKNSSGSKETPANVPAFTYLASNYAQSMPLNRLPQCPFDVLTGIFSVALSGTAQLLTALSKLLEEQIDCFISTPEIDVLEYATVATFHYHRILLGRYSVQLKQILYWIETRGGAGWHSAGVASESVETWSQLSGTARRLLENCGNLVEKCDHGEALVQDKRSVDEERLSRQRASSMTQLTWVTTFVTVFWVPLSCLTAIFGMNFREFNSGTLSIWIWVLCLIPCIGVSLIMLHFIDRRSNTSSTGMRSLRLLRIFRSKGYQEGMFEPIETRR